AVGLHAVRSRKSTRLTFYPDFHEWIGERHRRKMKRVQNAAAGSVHDNAKYCTSRLVRSPGVDRSCLHASKSKGTIHALFPRRRSAQGTSSDIRPAYEALRASKSSAALLGSRESTQPTAPHN